MIEKINKYISKSKNTLKVFFKKNKKKKTIDKYKILKKKKKKIIEDKERKRKKHNYQLNLNLNSKYIKNIFIWVFLIILIIIVLIIKWPFFKIENINIIKLDENVNIALIEKKLNKIKWKILFNIDNKNIENIIRNTEQNIKDISITKILPKTLKITLSSYKSVLKTTLNWNKYIITENWSFVPTKKKNEDLTEIVIRNLELQNYPNYKKILDENILKKIEYIENKLNDNILNIKINNIIYFKKEREIHFIINNKNRIIFDIEWNIDENLEQLFVFNKEKKEITKDWIIYIDNRIKGKVFYCEKTEISNCLKNLNYIYNENLKTSDYKTEDIKK